jgi:hypothetical protein
MAIQAHDNKWRVSVDGQLDYPFDTQGEADCFAAMMQKEGFDTFVYHSKPTTDVEGGA